MTQGNSKYPISQFIARIINESGLSISEFTARIGYRNIAKGMRRLNEWLQDGSGQEDCVQRITSGYAHYAGELQAALDETEKIHEQEYDDEIREIEERERRRFRPFVWVQTEDGAHQFFTAIMERKVKVLWFKDDIVHLPKSEQMAIARRVVQEHYAATNGRYPGFGAILRYQFADTFDTSLVLDVAGNVMEENGGRFLLPEVWMELHR